MGVPSNPGGGLIGLGYDLNLEDPSSIHHTIDPWGFQSVFSSYFAVFFTFIFGSTIGKAHMS